MKGWFAAASDRVLRRKLNLAAYRRAAVSSTLITLFSLKIMEVHHHPQLEHKPKPWKEYLLEYIMIFLAVMTGFFAESYREHPSERAKEHEYVVSIKKDLIIESKNLAFWIPSILERVQKFDTLISYLETAGAVANGSNMYLLARISTRNTIFVPGDNTIMEMKSSGNLRLIRDRDIINNLMEMEKQVQQYRNLLDVEGKEDMMTYPLMGSLSISLITAPSGNPQLISHDAEKINSLVFYLHQRKSSFLGEARMLTGIKRLVDQTTKQIDHNYDLSED